MDFASVYNYYEHLVFEYILEEIVPKYEGKYEGKYDGGEYFLDVACYSLTRLPSRYIRHEIDMAFYLAPGEREEMMTRVKDVVATAMEFIDSRQT